MVQIKNRREEIQNWRGEGVRRPQKVSQQPGEHNMRKREEWAGKSSWGAPGWLSGWVSAFGSGHGLGVLGWSPASSSPQGACFSLCQSLPLSVYLSWIIFFKKEAYSYSCRSLLGDKVTGESPIVGPRASASFLTQGEGHTPRTPRSEGKRKRKRKK